MRDIGLDPATGGGKRSDAKRVQDQTRRLFGASIGFQQTVSLNGREGERRLNMQVAAQSELWWDPKSPDQIGLWGSWVELGEKFYQAITAAPVPLDTRALRALKRSPLALDLYAWATHKALSVQRKGKPQYVPWRGLMMQFGADYSDLKNTPENDSCEILTQVLMNRHQLLVWAKRRPSRPSGACGPTAVVPALAGTGVGTVRTG